MLLVFSCFSYKAEAQDASWEETQNILNQSNLGAWSGSFVATGGDGTWAGYSGGQVPNIGATGTIRFGYGGGTVWQSVGVMEALKQAGILVHGYSYSWKIKNWNANAGTGGMQAAQDTMQVQVAVYDTSNQIVDIRTFDYSYWISDWTLFSGTQLFQNSQNGSDLSSLQMSVTGKDAGYWAGYYGPEFREYQIKWLYSADACKSDPLSSTECPGYAEAYLAQQCQANPLYATTCPGYAQAYLAQQCSLNALYDPSCPGYAQAVAVQLAQEQAATTSATTETTEVVANDGSVNVDTLIEQSTSSAPVESVESVNNTEPVTVTETATATATEQAIAETGKDAVTAEIEKTTEAIAQSSPDAVVASDPKERELEQANSMDLSKMSQREILNALNKLGVLGNPATNGTGDPTGLGRDTVDGVNTVAGLTSGTIANNGTVGSVGGATFGADGSVSFEMQINNDVYQVTLFKEVSQNPEETGGDASKDLNTVFGGPAALEDNPGLASMQNQQNEMRETFLSRMVRERIEEVAKDIVKNSQQQSEDSNGPVVQNLTNDYGQTDALSVSNVSQSDVIAEMGSNDGFDVYSKQNITQPQFYADVVIYKEQLPENRRGLRNGLAQQVLHEKMIELQYNKEK